MRGILAPVPVVAAGGIRQNAAMGQEGEQLVIDVQGHALAASLFRARESKTVVLVNSATAVPRQFYRYFADYLRASGWSALTYDYRGIGGSAPGTLAGFDVRMRDWVLRDMSGVIDWVAANLAPERLYCVGHSFGGQALGMVANPEAVRAAVGVSAQSGYWGVQGGAEKLRTGIAVHTLMPLFAKTLGYFPWSKLARGEDLPGGVALEWSRWCRNRNYLLDDETLPLDRYQRFEAPLLAYSIEDDLWGTARAVDEMMRAYSNVTRRHIVPADYGFDALGHMGYFRRNSATLWDEAIAWLDAN